jgi:hypothetical protein
MSSYPLMVSHNSYWSYQKDDLLELEQKIATKGRGFYYSQTNDAYTCLQTESQLSLLNNYLKNNQLLSARQNTYLNALHEVSSVAIELNGLLSHMNSSLSNQDYSYSMQIESMLDRLSNTLNTIHQNEFIFAGTRSQTKAVSPLNDLPPLEPPYAQDTSYFQGVSVKDLDVYTDNAHTIQLVRLTADHPAIEGIIRALRIAKTLDVETMIDNPMFQKTMEILTETSHQLNTIETSSIFYYQTLQQDILDISYTISELTELYEFYSTDDPDITLAKFKDRQIQMELMRDLFVNNLNQQKQFLETFSRI